MRDDEQKFGYAVDGELDQSQVLGDDDAVAGVEHLRDDERGVLQILPLMRLRYGGSAARWGFAIYSASNNCYTDSILPTGTFAGNPQDTLDCACDLHLTHSSP